MANPVDEVARILRAASIAYSQAPVRRILVIPMSPAPNGGPWAQALQSPAFRDSQIPFSVSSNEDDAGMAALPERGDIGNGGLQTEFQLTDGT